MPQPPDSLPPDVVQALQAGNKIEAIKRLREHTGLGLKEAKDLVDAAGPALGFGKPRAALAPGEVPRRAGAGWWVVGALLVAVVAWFVVRRL